PFHPLPSLLPVPPIHHAPPRHPLHCRILPISILVLIPPITKTYTLSLHDALPIYHIVADQGLKGQRSHELCGILGHDDLHVIAGSEEHTSELQSRVDVVCRLPPENKKISPTRQKLTPRDH